MLKRDVSVSRPAGRLPPSVKPHALSRAWGQEADAFAPKDCPPPPGIQEDGFQVTIAGNKETRGAFHLSSQRCRHLPQGTLGLRLLFELFRELLFLQ